MHPKRKSVSHLIDKKAHDVIKKLLPDCWSIRDYKPDYGIDLAIEVFEKSEDTRNDDIKFDTLGEHFFVQVKGTEKVEKSKLKIHKRNNVEKEPAQESEFVKLINVIDFTIDTSELLTIHRMGAVIPVLLFHVDIKSEEIYYICLNDYIDKVILPRDQSIFKQKSKTLKIPLSNKITAEPNSLIPLYFYSKRPKYYSFFNKASYQQKELDYIDDQRLIQQCQYFAKILLNFDIWKQHNYWPILTKIHDHLTNLVEKGAPAYFSNNENAAIDDSGKIWETNTSEGELYTQKEVLQKFEIRALWDSLRNLGAVYEDCCREWFLPTMLGTMCQ